MKAFILAGGMGSRLMPLTKDIPKVMVTIGDRPALEHIIRLCVRHDIKEIIIGLHYLPEKIQDYFEDGKKFHVNISYSYEPHMMGTAGAIKLASAFLCKEDFFVFNGDVMTNVDLQAMHIYHKNKGGLATVLVHPTDHPFDSDIVAYNQNFLVSHFFRPRAGDVFRAISKTGTHIFRPEVLDFIPAGVEYSLEKQLLPDLLLKGQLLYAYYSDCYSKDMGTPSRLTQVIDDYKHGKF